MEHILPRSMLKTNPNGKQLSQLISFVSLASVEGNRLLLHPAGLKVIESQVLGNLHLVALESQRQSLLYNFYRSQHVLNQHSQERKTSGIWISNFPRYDVETQTQYLFLETWAVTPADRILIHSVCSLICSCLLVDKDISDLTYLASGESRVCFSRSKDNRQMRKQEVAHLVLLDIKKGHSGSLRGDHNAIYAFLNQLKVFVECEAFYKNLHLLTLASDRLQAQDWDYVSQFEQQVRTICQSEPHKTYDLLRGPVLSWYLEKIRDEVNSGRGVIEIQQCLQIDVSEGYVAFSKASEAYKHRIEKSVRQQGLPNIREVLDIAREEALQEYRRHSENAEYLVFLGDFIDVKERRIIDENNRIFQLQNLQFLQHGSEKLLQRVASEAMDHQTANREIQLLADQYKATQFGDNRFEVLAECLKHLHEAVSKIVGEHEGLKVKKEMQAISEQKALMEKKLKEYKAKLKERPGRDSQQGGPSSAANAQGGGCCNSCSVM